MRPTHRPGVCNQDVSKPHLIQKGDNVYLVQAWTISRQAKRAARKLDIDELCRLADAAGDDDLEEIIVILQQTIQRMNNKIK